MNERGHLNSSASLTRATSITVRLTVCLLLCTHVVVIRLVRDLTARTTVASALYIDYLLLFLYTCEREHFEFVMCECLLDLLL